MELPIIIPGWPAVIFKVGRCRIGSRFEKKKKKGGGEGVCEAAISRYKMVGMYWWPYD